MGKNGSVIANGVLSFFVLACGVVFSILIAELEKKLVEMINAVSGGASINTSVLSSNLPIWSLGFAYMVPGLLGVIAAAVEKKGLYVTQMVFSIITIIIMGIFFIIALIALGALATYSPSSCLADGDICKCGDISFNKDFTCGDLSAMYAMSVSLMVFLVLAWILTLAATIVCGILACRHEPLQPAFAVQQMPATSVVNVTSSQMAYAQQHDSAKLVNNMQY